jgi:hypothetical protein
MVISVEETMSSNFKDEGATLSGLNLDALRAAKRRIDEIGWKLCHNLSVPELGLSLDEALSLGCLLKRVLPDE